MQTLTQPSLLLKPFAEQGDKNTIPDVNTDQTEPQKADFTNGFPAITSLPMEQGGLPPERKDFNALGYLTTLYDFFYQCGGTFTFDPTVSTAIGGYPLGARLWYTNSDGVSMIVRSNIQNNTNNFLTDDSVVGPVGDTTKPWAIEKFQGMVSTYPLLSFMWSDHQMNDSAWLDADTFSWQSGSVYTDAYNHLVDDVDGATEQSETIGSYTIYYKLASDGHKICGADQETTVANIYAETGVAWYFILDKTNSRFKLPRTKYGFVGSRGAIEQYVPESLPNITGNFVPSTGDAAINPGSSGAFYHESIGTTAGNYAGSGQRNTYRFYLDASRSSSAYQNNAPVQQRATQMRLYFYVGAYTQTAAEQTAGLNTELFNGKMDLDAGNATSGALNTLLSFANSTSKETICGWMGIDTSSSISRTLDTTYTATRNCWIYHDENQNNTSAFYVDGVEVYRTSWHAGYTSAKGSALVFVAKGQTWHAENGYSVTEFGTLGG